MGRTCLPSTGSAPRPSCSRRCSSRRGPKSSGRPLTAGPRWPAGLVFVLSRTESRGWIHDQVQAAATAALDAGDAALVLVLVAAAAAAAVAAAVLRVLPASAAAASRVGSAAPRRVPPPRSGSTRSRGNLAAGAGAATEEKDTCSRRPSRRGSSSCSKWYLLRARSRGTSGSGTATSRARPWRGPDAVGPDDPTGCPRRATGGPTTKWVRSAALGGTDREQDPHSRGQAPPSVNFLEKGLRANGFTTVTTADGVSALRARARRGGTSSTSKKGSRSWTASRSRRCALIFFVCPVVRAHRPGRRRGHSGPPIAGCRRLREQAVRLRGAAGPGEAPAPAAQRGEGKGDPAARGRAQFWTCAPPAPTSRAGQSEVSAREFALAQVLMRHPDQVLSRGQLLSRVWGYDLDPRVQAWSTSTSGTWRANTISRRGGAWATGSRSREDAPSGGAGGVLLTVWGTVAVALIGFVVVLEHMHVASVDRRIDEGLVQEAGRARPARGRDRPRGTLGALWGRAAGPRGLVLAATFPVTQNLRVPPGSPPRTTRTVRASGGLPGPLSLAAALELGERRLEYLAVPVVAGNRARPPRSWSSTTTRGSRGGRGHPARRGRRRRLPGVRRPRGLAGRRAGARPAAPAHREHPQPGQQQARATSAQLFQPFRRRRGDHPLRPTRIQTGSTPPSPCSGTSSPTPVTSCAPPSPSSGAIWSSIQLRPRGQLSVALVSQQLNRGMVDDLLTLTRAGRPDFGADRSGRRGRARGRGGAQGRGPRQPAGVSRAAASSWCCSPTRDASRRP